MAPANPPEHTELRGRDATVDISDDHPDHPDGAVVRIRSDGEPGAASEAARLACAARRARARVPAPPVGVGPASPVAVPAERT